MADRDPLTPSTRPRTRRRRRRVGTVVVVLALAVVAVTAALAIGHAGNRHATPPPPPPPPPKPFRIVFPEGFTRTQMAVRVKDVAKIAERERHKPVRLSQAGYLAASRHAWVPCFGQANRPNLEGFLFPATYDFLRQTRALVLVQAQLAAFCRNWSGVNLSYAISKHLTPYDVLKIASMIEREAVAPSERRLVSAVIYNRLHDHMQLGIDATLRYGLHIPATKSITKSELASNNPYNTRKFYGLPPTPIASPGLAAIQAAAHPAKVGYLYYARKPDKIHHFFTASGAAFNQYLATHGYGTH